MEEKARNLLLEKTRAGWLTNRTHTAGCHNTIGFAELLGHLLLILLLILHHGSETETNASYLPQPNSS